MANRVAANAALLAICASLSGCEDGPDRPPPAPVDTASQNLNEEETRVDADPALPVNSELLTRSSWQDPFVDSFWQTDGWDFRTEQMLAEESPARATLLRPWSRLMIEAQCDALQADSFPAAGAALQLGFRQSHGKAQVRVEIWRDHIELQQLVDAGHWQTLKSSRFDAEVSGGRLRVNLTGNRILVAWNDRLVLNADRPSAISRPVFVEFQSTGCPVVVSEMRVEGEYTSS